jgi:heme oxygenase
MPMSDIATIASDAALSAALRARTAPLHLRVEQLLGLPDAIADHWDYGRWLARLFGLYEPLERSFHAFDEWDRLGLPLDRRNPCARLSGDLLALGIDPHHVPRASLAMLPRLPTFPHALGALYVLEGSTLGGRMILRDLEARLGPQIVGAMCFLRGHGAETGPMWQSFRTALDRFGQASPRLREDVVAGAERTFDAILAWFTPCRGGGVSGP